MRSRAAVLLCLLPAIARAQATFTLTVHETSGKSPGFVNIAECSQETPDLLSFSWIFTGTAAIASTQIYVDSATCSTNSTTRESLATISVSPDAGTWPPSGGKTPLELLQLLSFDCSVSRPLYVCAFGLDSLGQTAAIAQANLQIDTTVPAAPINVSASPGDGALNVSWDEGTGGTGASSYYAVTATSQSDPGDTRTSGQISNTSYRISGLVNGTPYDVTVVAYTISDNASPPSEPVVGTPEPVDDFWRHYKGDGGREEGGCGQGGPGPLALLPLLPLAPRLRRRGP